MHTLRLVPLALLSVLLPATSSTAQSLVHLWAFENNYQDTSGSGNHGTATGSPTFVAGQFGQAVSLQSPADGVNLDFGASNLPLGAGDAWSMNLWAKLSEAPGSLEYLAGFGVDDGFVSEGDFTDIGATRSYITVDQNFYFWGGATDLDSGHIYESDDQWHMYTITFNGSLMTMYKDAVPVRQGTPGPNPWADAFDEVHVGNPSNWNSNFDGAIDEFAIFDGELSDAQVGGLFFNNDINEPVSLIPHLVVNRDSGEIVLMNDSIYDLEILGYTVRSASGSLDPSVWETIAGRYDASPGDGSVDDDAWTVLTDTDLQFSVEFTEGAPGTDGGTIESGTTINFGAGAWVKNYLEDVEIDLLLNDGEGTVQTLVATFVGNNGEAYAFGDLDASGGPLDANDWIAFRSAPNSDLSGATPTQAYLGGDLDGDLDKDIYDFSEFVAAYESVNGAGSFALMATSVPEPTAVCLLAPAVLLVAARRRVGRMLNKGLALLLLGGICSLLVATPASADLWGYYQMNGTSDNQAANPNTDLTLYGNAGYAGSVHPGLGAALSLDGDGDGAIGQNFNVFTTNNVTVAAWVYADSLEGEWNTIVKNWGQNVGGQFHFGLGSFNTNTLQNILGSGATAADGNDFAEGEWVHTAFVLDATAGEHRLYINGQVVANVAYNGIFNPGGASALGVGVKPNDTGDAIPPAGSGPGFWNGRIDDVALFNEALSTAEVNQLYLNGLAGIQADGTTVPYLRLLVDRETGDISLVNDSPGAVDINAYQLGSAAGSLRPDQLEDLAGNAGFPTGDGMGTGWELDGANSPHQLLEAYLTGSSTFSVGTISLGSVFAPGSAEDITFAYRNSEGFIVESLVEYVGVGPDILIGDYNDDGTVDAADYTVWRNNLGSLTPLMNRDPANTGEVSVDDYLSWKAYFGTSSFAALTGSVAVPEPATGGLLLLALLAFGGRRRR